MIPLAIPNLAGNEARYLAECVATNFVSSVGPFVDRLETMVATSAGARHAVATSSGTAGLHVALTTVGVGRDDLVILPSFTFIASANAIAQCGATPWLFDVTADSWTLDVAAVATALERECARRGDALVHVATGRRVAAVLPVHTLGVPADLDALVPLARHHRLPIVADGAAALGARLRGRPIGALGADLTVLSFNGNKTVTAGGGGAVLGTDAALCARVRHLSTTARVGSDYDHDVVGFNYRMTNLQAAVGCAQLERLDALVAAKRRIADGYDRGLGTLPGVGTFPRPPWADSACWFSGITLDTRVARAIRPLLRAVGVDSRPFWKPVHLQAPYREAPAGALPVAESIWGTVLTLPCSTSLSDDEQAIVVAAVRDCLRDGVRDSL